MSKKSILLLTIGIFLGATIAGFTLTRLFPYTFHGTILQAPDTAPDFTLTAHTGQSASLRDFRGKLVIMFFGYTHCPDVCPATLGVTAKAMDLLGKKAEDVQVLFISFDPERDTPEKLAEYVTYFHPEFTGLTGTPEQIAQVAALYGVYYAKQDADSENDYWMDHTASILIIDRTGHLKLILPFGVNAKDMAADLRMLLK